MFEKCGKGDHIAAIVRVIELVVWTVSVTGSRCAVCTSFRRRSLL